MIYDTIIIGAGPAGITAAIYAARKKMKTLVISPNIGGQAAWSGNIENYTGFQYITGPELAQKFEEHIKKFNVTYIKDEVECIGKKQSIFEVKTKNKEYYSKTVIVATGRKHKNLGIPGEEEFKNKGVMYCATCDGPLFSGMDVAVIGGGNSALDACIQLMNIANKIYLININPSLKGDEIMIEKVLDAQNVEVMNNTEIKEILGDKFVNGIKVETKNKERKKEEKILNVKGVFIEIGTVPVKTVAECQGIKLNADNEIIVNEKCETNMPGFFAAGDVTNVPEKQIIVAAGQGCIAALSAFKYISSNKF